ncbi:hypothetical protein F53441_8084 [Fusarium austroafricanum]|uniref:F-box domain-containing protein n=1 Tax=Fusarium austroafricanum TaxID=2364996 RepID=A0A8H4KFT5_9HYPO|nr:hypothetical protein F53441_8084 [Fusarium austroafricanum]
MYLPSPRKERLDRLFDDLSPWDILYLRQKVRDANITLAGLQDLPQELIYSILSYLEFDDYRCCIWTCKKWNATWTQEAVITQALRHFFPGLQIRYPETSPQDLYSAQLKLHLKWRQPHSKSTWIPWNLESCPFFTDLPEVAGTGAESVDAPRPFLYNKGKLVWQPSPRTFIVDDLRTRQRLRFVPPGSAMTGEKYQTAALSDQLLVLLEVNQNDRTVLHLAYLDSKTVYFVTDTAQVLRFTWGGKLVNLQFFGKASSIIKGYGKVLDSSPQILLHPTSEDTVFAVWIVSHGLEDKRFYSFVVVKFEDSQAVLKKSPLLRSGPPVESQTTVAPLHWEYIVIMGSTQSKRASYVNALSHNSRRRHSRSRRDKYADDASYRKPRGIITTMGTHPPQKQRPEILYYGISGR